ncbi:MAG TPA: nucleotidyltransferase domain-containing protein [Blastocatellia bacterium]|nr:nucleotidyltransferase domain-containing protein [Blastocatellia bacterium]
MKQLLPKQRELVSLLSNRLAAIPGIRAVVLGGSYARGRAHTGSDIDLGILYSEAAPFSVQALRDLAEDVNDTAGPVVTNFYEWGLWVNGGAWLTVGGQRIDFIYRSLEHLERIITEAEAGRYELDYAQQPPFGFFSATYLGEVAVCIPLYDPQGRVELLKRRVEEYPEALRQAVVQDYLWAAEFGVAAFASKFAARADAYGTSACLTRAINQLVLVLFALNRKYPVNDKTALAEVAEFDHAPREFKTRVQQTLGHLGNSVVELTTAVERVEQLIVEVVELTEGLYRPRFQLPN